MFKFFYRKIYTKIFSDYCTVLRRVTKDCKSILDLGCGKNSVLEFFPKDIYKVGVDIYAPYLEESRKKNIHDGYYNINVLEADKYFKEKSFDCVFAGDLIEHLDKQEGFRLIEIMEKLARKKVVIYTPNGFLPMEKRDGNEFYIHKSGWQVREMQDMGFKVIGMGGWYKLREDDTGIKFKPKFFWRIISDITQFYTKTHPLYAKQILCVKEIKKG